MSAADALCAGLPALLDAACALLAPARPVGLGVVCAEPAGRALFVYADVFGCTGYRARVDELPLGFRPRGSGPIEIDAAGFAANPSGLVESRLTQPELPGQFERPPQIARILSLPIKAADPPAILTVSLGGALPLDATAAAHLEALAADAGRLLDRKESADEELERLRRLEAVEELLPALFQTLDVREIFDTLSAITKDVLPHDFASVGLFNDSLTHITLFAKTSSLSPARVPRPHALPACPDWRLALPPDPRPGNAASGQQDGLQLPPRRPVVDPRRHSPRRSGDRRPQLHVA